MSVKVIRRITGGVAFSLFAFVGLAEAQEVESTLVEECVAQVQPARLSPQTRPVNLSAVYTESIGKVLSALIDEASGVEIVDISQSEPDPDAPNPATEVRLRLDLSDAVAGEWTLQFQGEEGNCTAKVMVEEGDGTESE